MNTLKQQIHQLLRENHPFTLVLYLTALCVALLLFFKLGTKLGDHDETTPPTSTEETIPLQTAPKAVTQETINAWELPPFPMLDTEGTSHTIRDWSGKTILLNFWATWCPPCKREIPEFIEYQMMYGDHGFQIIGVGIDDPERIKEATQTLQINYPVLLATDAEMMSQWGNRDQVLPYSVVIDRNGQIRYIHRGQLFPATFEQTIKPIIFE